MLDMENKADKLLKVLYIGNKSEPWENLKSSGLFEAFRIDTAIEAINYLQIEKNVDAIIAQTHNYFEDGIQIKEILNQKELLKNMPYILISFKDEPEVFQRSFDAGIDDYFRNPIDPQRIYNRITYLQNHTDELGISIVKKQSFHDDAPEGLYKTPFIKRLFDVTFAGLALLFLSPIMLIVAIAIKLESKGPFYYVSKRVGANYKTFGFLKFRSMRLNADRLLSKKDMEKLNQYAKETIVECPKCAKLPKGQYCSKQDDLNWGDHEIICKNLNLMREEFKATYLKLENDPRITRVGKFIRNTSIDELPQLINIIKGDMSIVGNRPLPEYEAEKLMTDKKKKDTIDKKRNKRFLAAAGLTGLWQVELRGKGGEMSEEERFALDAEYANNNSFWGDIKLIFRTVKIFIQPGNV